MRLVGILMRLRAQYRVVEQNGRTERIMEKLGSGLVIEARADDAWMLSRRGVKPSNVECNTVARDAGIRNGFTVATSEGNGGTWQYRLITPIDDDLEIATGTLCPSCEERTLVIPEHCPKCGHGTSEAQITLAVTPEEHELFELTHNPRADMRPGEPLPMTLQLKEGILYHFEAFGTVWTASYSTTRDNPIWCCTLEHLEGPSGNHEFNSLEAFKTWFRQSGQHPPITAPARWAGAA